MTNTNNAVKVAVENTTYAFDRLFDYLVPPSLIGHIQLGCRVTVPFGQGSKVRHGMVMSILAVESTEKLKEVNALVDPVPLLDDEALQMIVWLKEQTFCTYYEAAKLLLPAGLHLKRGASGKKNGTPLVPVRTEIHLTSEQQTAYDGILGRLDSGNPGTSLLFGITGSGKTSVYLRLIDTVADRGQGVILMVPEIALTPQMVQIFQQRYGDAVEVLHSKLAAGERLRAWQRVKKGEAKIVIGTRSAVFAPVQSLGLIIMDEEQESTYKSESTPRYHAREVARFRCKYHKGLLLLGSATPSMESFYRAKRGQYSFWQIKGRYGSAKLPQVTIADMLEEQLEGNTSGFSSLLLEKMRTALEFRQQVILLLNRRGYQTLVCCRSCKTAYTCKNCSVAMVYHADSSRLHCHYCGSTVPITVTCPACEQDKLQYIGWGTQRVEETLGLYFPEARILRMDADTTTVKDAFETQLGRFAAGEYDIMVGTQMVAKGLNFPNVTVVGVLNADQSLYAEDFRSYERVFSLLTQVVGRSGRGKSTGEAVIQTYTPENSVITRAAEQDYEGFFQDEIEMRRLMLYPPFADICCAGFSGTDENLVKDAATFFMSLLLQLAKQDYPSIPLRVLEPTKASVYKVNQKFRYRIIIKCRNDNIFREMAVKLLELWYSEKRFRKVSIFLDINLDYLN